MKIVVSAGAGYLDCPVSLVFARCSVLLFVDTDTMSFEAVDNPAMDTPGGAGTRAAQFVVERGVRAVLSGNIGPNARQVLSAAQVPMYLVKGGTVRQAVEAFRQGQLTRAE